MTTLQDIKLRCTEIYEDIKTLLIETGYDSYGQICIVPPGDTIEARTLYYGLQKYIGELESAGLLMDQILGKETEMGAVTKDVDGNYILHGHPLEGGDVIQVFDEEKQCWRICLLDNSYTDDDPKVVIVKGPQKDLDGVMVRRVKRNQEKA